MKTYAILALILAAGGAGAGWLYEHDQRVAALAVAEVYEARADSLTAVAAEATETAEEERAAALAAQERADSARAQAERAEARAQRRVAAAQAAQDSLEARVTAMVPDSVQAALAAFIAARNDERAGHEAEKVELRAQLRAADSVATAQTRRALAEYERAEAEAARANALDLALQSVRAGTSRGFVERWGERALWTAAGALVGYVAGGR